MGKLRNARREAFARGLAEGQTVQQAFTSAGYSFHRQTAHRLSSSPVIKARVLELKEPKQAPGKNGRDEGGRFQTGSNGGPGRPKGSRNKLAEAFLADLCVEWETSGQTALARVAEMDPTAYVKIVASILPSKIDATLAIDVDFAKDVREFAQAWRLAKSYIGADDHQMIELQPIRDDERETERDIQTFSAEKGVQGP
jgi:hypothetical protein